MWAAVTGGHVAVARLLLSAGAQVERRLKGRSLLVHCVLERRFELTKLLLAARANVDGPSAVGPSGEGGGSTALLAACEADDLRAMQLLLDHAASPNLARQDGATALYLSSAHGHTAAVPSLGTRSDDLWMARRRCAPSSPHPCALGASCP